MTLEEFRAHCAKFPGFSEDLPFGPEVLAFRVGGRIFALMDVDAFESVNLKCDPERAVDLREQHPGITPGYHMNKRHWNTVLTDGSVPYRVLLELARHSYDLVRASLPKKLRDGLG
ncbi:MAG: MmcQ/YjbR family DNA-binding protein [Flavobacteriales bacterium]|jgi:predicted DNA-binding protein (MmcQ/YjbR family)|nr:MmcQ/YjbR family DNA-binding protein [Flavobacteriales bacterium]MBK7943227.1 MmcQ/YjbR family DNA-binding protein [Flavobacteriales bacterium]MBK9701723.1 MmcQ/YjbR family DNA-binding protein [Flavobacteriales bacterium]